MHLISSSGLRGRPPPESLRQAVRCTHRGLILKTTPGAIYSRPGPTVRVPSHVLCLTQEHICRDLLYLRSRNHTRNIFKADDSFQW